MKVAIVHDFLNQHGGAENVVETLHELYPDAPVFTTIYRPDRLGPAFKSMDVRTSFMQGWPFMDRHFKKYLLFYPRAVESFDLKGYDVVISSSSAFAKGAKAAGACHVCYCYTPMRFAWRTESYLEKEDMPSLLKALLPPVLRRLKRWDLRTVGRVHHYVAISQYIRDRIRQSYGRESDVIYPPVDVAGFRIDRSPGDSFLVVSRLNAYKNIDIVVEAFNRLALPLTIIGTGPHGPALRKMAGKTVTFLGRLPREELAGHMGRCRALLFPGEEDFGITPVEAMAAGRPVIALGRGGALETVEEGVSGVFFPNPSVEDVVDAVRRFQGMTFDPARIRGRAERFDKEIFKRDFKALVEKKWAAFSSGRKAAP